MNRMSYHYIEAYLLASKRLEMMGSSPSLSSLGLGSLGSFRSQFKDAQCHQKHTEDAWDEALKEKKKFDKEASTSMETEGQLRKELENLRAKAEASVACAQGEAMADFKNSLEFSDLYIRGFIDCYLEAMIDWSFLEKAMGPESYNAMMVVATGAESPEGKNQEGVEDITRGGNEGDA
ncbi:hypothetical protein PanWU01x14_213630 [Parasponia andersonii]|uniref:Uncharacterized protein n=1 Tax=Parasponia andersonii TaxID=3476 RepID=A0A2P5BSM1_PARAD|nr:hypothetical protein PanWU01x14_213630 [Parasponia andersonii]